MYSVQKDWTIETRFREVWVKYEFRQMANIAELQMGNGEVFVGKWFMYHILQFSLNIGRDD